jgi:type I restriction enzyme M protein
MNDLGLFETTGKIAAIIVQQGKVLDYIDGITQRNETPEEYVRQEIAKSIVREYGYSKRDIEIEYTIPSGSRKPRADIVIFAKNSLHKIEDIKIIIECKAPTIKPADRKDGIGQLQSYMSNSINSVYGMWTNGTERLCYRKAIQNNHLVFEEIIDIPEEGKDNDYSGRPSFDQLKPATSDALLFAFRRCHNYIAGNQGLQKPQAFWELLKLIFCKIHDERNNDEVDFYASASERDGMVGNMKIKARMDVLFENVKSDYPQIFKPSEIIDLSPRVLAYLVSQLQMYSLLESDIDVKGKAYEEIVGSNLRGDRGEFFTPRNICKMAVEMLDPHEKSTILDPACGTGGFLITAMNYVIEKIRIAEKNKGGSFERIEQATHARIRQFAEKCIIGIDFNPELVKASKMNMVMNNDGAGGLYQANSLERPAIWAKELRDREPLGKIDLLFTNPPFGSKIPVTDPSILEQYDLGHIWTYDTVNDNWIKTKNIQKSQPPEILFIERCLKFLKPGTGKMAIVLPDGILGSPGLGYVREWILSNAKLLASIDLHPDTFQPFVSIQTSLLILERKSDALISLEQAANTLTEYNIFMAIADHIGHDKRGNVVYVRDPKGNEIVEEFQASIKEYENGIPVFREQQTRKKVIDDNTIQIAQEFRKWLSEQD